MIWKAGDSDFGKRGHGGRECEVEYEGERKGTERGIGWKGRGNVYGATTGNLNEGKTVSVML